MDRTEQMDDTSSFAMIEARTADGSSSSPMRLELPSISPSASLSDFAGRSCLSVVVSETAGPDPLAGLPGC